MTDCINMEEDGEQRLAYLINKTKQQEQGQYQYVINLPQTSLAVTETFAFVVLVLLCQNIKYRRFTPFRFNWVFSILYSLFLFFTIYIQTYLQDELQITSWIVMFFSLIASVFYFADIVSICLDKTSIIIGVSILLVIVLAVVDIILLPDAWFVNNIIGILVAGTIIKFIVVKSLKSAIGPLLFLWLFFILRQFAVIAHLQNFQQVLQIKIVPLFLQLPSLLNDSENGYICSAFGTSKIITMGLMLNFSVRIDLFFSNRFYTSVCALAVFLSLLTEGLIEYLSDQLPVMEYTSVIMFIPLSFFLMLLMGSKRGEWAQIWHGSFHDMAVDRKSIKKESTILDQEQIDKYLNPLKIDPTTFQ